MVGRGNHSKNLSRVFQAGFSMGGNSPRYGEDTPFRVSSEPDPPFRCFEKSCRPNHRKQRKWQVIRDLKDLKLIVEEAMAAMQWFSWSSQIQCSLLDARSISLNLVQSMYENEKKCFQGFLGDWVAALFFFFFFRMYFVLRFPWVPVQAMNFP